MNGNSLTVKDPFHHPDNAGTVIVVPQQRGDDQREDDLNKFLRSKDVVKNRRIYIFIPHQDHVEALLNVFPRFCHQLLPTGLIFTDKAHGVHGEETGIYFIPTPHTFIGPFNAVWKPFEGGLAIRDVEDIAPDAFHRCGDQVRFAVKIILEGADGDIAGLRHAADVDGRQAVLLDQLTAGLQDGLFGSDDRVHVFTPHSERCSL